jgi:hypothetical protein
LGPAIRAGGKREQDDEKGDDLVTHLTYRVSR